MLGLSNDTKIVSIGRTVWPQSTRVMDRRTDGIDIAYTTNAASQLSSQKQAMVGDASALGLQLDAVVRACGLTRQALPHLSGPHMIDVQ